MSMSEPKRPVRWTAWLNHAAFVLVLAVAAWLRLSGSDWGELQHQHPDENFVVSVTYDIQPRARAAETLGMPPNSTRDPWRLTYPEAFPDCQEWGGYFDTACSPLNPQNSGKAFYPYGTLPVLLVRGMAEALDQMGNLKEFGRQMSAAADLLTILLLYVIATRLYGSRVALLAAAFSAFAPMQIQQSHFFTTDNFATLFTFVALLFAVEIVKSGKRAEGEGSRGWLKDRLLWLSVLFGLGFGMAVASKLNAAPMALLLPFAFLIRSLRKDPETPPDPWGRVLVYLVAGGLAAVLAFRIFQPYAFSGLGFNPQWVANIREQRLQASPNASQYWNLQWARRTHLYSFENLTVWGLGLPLGILAWTGFLWMGWRIFRGEWNRHLLVWSWTAVYFLWQSLQFNPTMRYQLPIYPLLAMMAAWLVFEGAKRRADAEEIVPPFLFRPSSLLLAAGALVLLVTAGWGTAFSRIYVRPETRIAASEWIFQNVPGPITLQVESPQGGILAQPLPFYSSSPIQSESPFQTVFTARNTGDLSGILLPHVADQAFSGPQTLRFTLSQSPDPLPGQALATGFVEADFSPRQDARGEAVQFAIDPPLPLAAGETYYLRFETTGGSLILSGAVLANETIDWDYPLPFRVSGYDPYGGIYRGGVALEVYWSDNQDKIARYQSVLDQIDYLLIPTNHQYAQITRLPERYPLTTAFYRALLGCPAGEDVIRCYRRAEPGMFRGELGFELVATFASYPTLGPVVLNDQAAEEAFTFYDHPKVFIFRKTEAYDPARIAAFLGSVDLSQVVELTPGEFANYRALDLMLPAEQLSTQRDNGTWSQLFDRGALLNRHPVLGLAAWYLLILLVGLATYPLVRAAFPGLPDGGYPLARTLGLLLWSWLAWLAGSAGIPYSKTTIAAALGVLLLAGLWQAWRQRVELKEIWAKRWKYFAAIELLFLLFFLLDLFIRLGNPDLWHPAKGGERPMDFAYLNAILKSTTFPPYDPWFAGGYINYYYYGYVIVATPVKLLGILPSVAYNFLLPTLFACLALAAFSVGWNLLERGSGEALVRWKGVLRRAPFYTGISAASAMVLLGNLGIVRMFIQGFQRIAAPGQIVPEGTGFLLKSWWSLKGFFLALAGIGLPYGPGDWYWFPSRALPDASGAPITEFPLFTFLYSDLHAHMIALPLTVLAIAWALSVLLARGSWKGWINTLLGLFLGGLVLGALKPTNTWDVYTYSVLGALVLFYAVWRYAPVEWIRLPVPDWAKRLLQAGGAVLLLLLFAKLTFLPFSNGFSQAYNSLETWKGSRSNISSYLVHWGVFLFFIVSWMAWETRQWLAETPVSALARLRPYRQLIYLVLFAILAVLLLQQIWVMSPSQNGPFKGLTVLWLAVPLAVWAALLLFRPGLSDERRLILFLVGTSLLLTMVVEIVVVRGDIGRMNTVFKFYLQAWVMLGLSAAACFGFLLTEVPKWLPGQRLAWQIAATFLATCGVLFLALGGMGKIKDRMTTTAPHTLDSMEYMNYSQYADFGTVFDLSQDYRAIRWLQDNVQGSPVILEAAPAGIQYTWFSRFSIYTGLPNVVGWQWHQQQQRVMFSNEVIARGLEVDAFYTTTDIFAALDFLRKYDARYIVVGQLERAKYAGSGLDKFEAFDGMYWLEVYRDQQTVIYALDPAGEGRP